MPGVGAACILLSFNPWDFNDAQKGVQKTQAGQAVILTGTGTNTVGDMPFILGGPLALGPGLPIPNGRTTGGDV